MCHQVSDGFRSCRGVCDDDGTREYVLLFHLHDYVHVLPHSFLLPHGYAHTGDYVLLPHAYDCDYVLLPHAYDYDHVHADTPYHGHVRLSLHPGLHRNHRHQSRISSPDLLLSQIPALEDFQVHPPAPSDLLPDPAVLPLSYHH